MAGRRIYNASNPAVPFFMPDNAGRQYVTGRQPWNPGETQADSGMPFFHMIPWPRPVASLVLLAHHSGIPRDRALLPVNNSTASQPENFLFLSGMVGKSRG